MANVSTVAQALDQLDETRAKTRKAIPWLWGIIVAVLLAVLAGPYAVAAIFSEIAENAAVHGDADKAMDYTLRSYSMMHPSVAIRVEALLAYEVSHPPTTHCSDTITSANALLQVELPASLRAVVLQARAVCESATAVGLGAQNPGVRDVYEQNALADYRTTALARHTALPGIADQPLQEFLLARQADAVGDTRTARALLNDIEAAHPGMLHRLASHAKAFPWLEAYETH
jgi:hypothetical protein